MNGAWIKPYLARFDALAPREQVAVSGLLLVALITVFYLFLLEPQMLRVKTLNEQRDSLQMQMRAGEQQISLLQKRLAQDPNAANRELLKRLKIQKRQIEDQLQTRMQGLVAPAQMAQVLEAVLTQSTRLKLEKLNNLPVRPLIEDEQNENEAAPMDVGVYRHGLQIEFRGSYLQMLNYLKLLKTLPWNFYWDSIEVNIDKYPQAQIVMTIHTLSFKPGWIGV